VIYMGVARCESIQRDLLGAGMSESMPVAVIKHATRKDEQSLITTLGQLVNDLRASALGSPAIMVIGETVRYAQHNERPYACAPLAQGAR
jgi:uroporphyrin-III C-methyltransferase